MMAIRAVTSFVLLLCWAAAQASDTADYEARFKRLLALSESTTSIPEAERLSRIERLYRQLFAGISEPARMKVMDAAQLSFAFRAAELATFYSDGSADYNDMRAIIGELENRKAAADDQRASLFRAMIGQRDFDSARAYRARYRALDVEAVPEIAPTDDRDTSRVVYQVSQDRNLLQPIALDVSSGPRLIVVAHPLCGPSRRAMESLADDAELAPIIRNRTVWLTPIDQRLYLKELRDWNREHPSTPVMITRHRTDWPMITAWATPQFYLLKDGKLIGRVEGWPKEGNRPALTTLLAKGGLLADKATTDVNP